MNVYEHNDYHHPATFSPYILNDANDEHLNNNTSPTMSDIHHNQPTLSFTGNSSSEDDDEKFDDDEYHHHHHIHQHHQEKRLQRNHSHPSSPDKASSTAASSATTSIKNNNRHNNNNNNNNNSPNKGIGGNGGNDRLFVCVLCERVFSRKEHAKRHCGKPKCIKKFIELAVEESAALDSSIDSSDYTALATSKIASSPSSL